MRVAEGHGREGLCPVFVEKGWQSAERDDKAVTEIGEAEGRGE